MFRAVARMAVVATCVTCMVAGLAAGAEKAKSRQAAKAPNSAKKQQAKASTTSGRGKKAAAREAAEKSAVDNAKALDGVVTAKGDKGYWLAVKTKSGAVDKYFPKAVAGVPEPALAAEIEALAIGDKVKIKWAPLDKKLRLLEVQRLAHDSTSQPAEDGLSFTGKVVARGDRWIQVSGHESTEKYFPRIRFGKDDDASLQQIAKAKVGDKVQVSYVVDEETRRRVLDVTVLEPAASQPAGKQL